MEATHEQRLDSTDTLRAVKHRRRRTQKAKKNWPGEAKKEREPPHKKKCQKLSRGGISKRLNCNPSLYLHLYRWKGEIEKERKTRFAVQLSADPTLEFDRLLKSRTLFGLPIKRVRRHLSQKKPHPNYADASPSHGKTRFGIRWKQVVFSSLPFRLSDILSKTVLCPISSLAHSMDDPLDSQASSDISN